MPIRKSTYSTCPPRFCEPLANPAASARRQRPDHRLSGALAEVAVISLPKYSRSRTQRKDRPACARPLGGLDERHAQRGVSGER